MKKLILLSLTALAMTGCSSPTTPYPKDPNQLVGNWQCTINYDDINIQTVDNLILSADGNLSNNGTINYPIQNPRFVYLVENNGYWSLKNDNITLNILSETVERNHSDNVQTELKQDKVLQQFEESLFGTLSEHDHNKTIELIITNYKPDKIEFKQEIKEQNIYKGECIKR